MSNDRSSADLAPDELEELAEAERLARRLPPKLLTKLLRAAVDLHEMRAGGTVRVDKEVSGREARYFLRGHGNETVSDRYDHVEKQDRRVREG